MSKLHGIAHGVGLLGAAIAALALGGCPRPEGDPAKSQTRLELARDFLLKNQLEAAEAEANKAIAYLNTNEEAYNVRGLVHHLRALSNQRLLEIEGCLTGLDAEALRGEVEKELGLAEADFRKAAALAPDYGEAFSNAGTAALLLGDADRKNVTASSTIANGARSWKAGSTGGWATTKLKTVPRPDIRTHSTVIERHASHIGWGGNLSVSHDPQRCTTSSRRRAASQ